MGEKDKKEERINFGRFITIKNKAREEGGCGKKKENQDVK